MFWYILLSFGSFSFLMYCVFLCQDRMEVFKCFIGIMQ
uniref:Uncharacterized protein n=1 Tax=Anguilla anguilla TaxID=7936 RepID=A0A0E9RCC5_ANGAN